MFKDVQIFFHSLTVEQRKSFYCLQILIILMTIFEIMGVASIAPFMALIGDVSLLEGDSIIANIYSKSSLDSPKDFSLILGIIVLLSLCFSGIVSMIATWRLSIFATKCGTDIGNRLYKHYMSQNWVFHVSRCSAHLSKQIAQECQRVTMGILLPLIQINSRLVLVVGMTSAIFIYNATVAFVGLVIFSFSYILLFKIVKNKLHKNGENISKSYGIRFRLMNEGFGGIKDTLLLGRNDEFIKRFNYSGHVLAKSLGDNVALSQVPRYLIELIAFGGIISLVLFLYNFYEGALGYILPVLSIFALAGFKLLPACQQIYSSFARIKGNLSAFESIKNDLINSNCNFKNKKILNAEKIRLQNKIELKNATFCYPSKKINALENLYLKINANSVVGLVGASGSGKSTAADVILGLLELDRGSLIVDGVKVTADNVRSWQSQIGFVSQSIFLTGGSIAENIAFGISKDEININLISRSLRMAHLEEFVETLDDGVNTLVGERGVQLSGGQRQRIGIARALYHNPSVLIFDEATSALDGITEKIIMNTIHEFQGSKTIILIAHRLKTVTKCDQIYHFDSGKIVASGTFQELIESNSDFRKMAELA